MSKKRMMRNPELWIGRRIPSDMSDDHLWDWGVCDDCQRFYHLDDMHALLWPMSEADWLLQEAVGVEEAQSFCADCLAGIMGEADEIDPEWRVRHGYVRSVSSAWRNQHADYYGIEMRLIGRM